MIGALAWSSVDRFGQQLVQFAIGIMLARLLSPSDIGLIGVLTIFVALSTVLIDGGFGQALIRKQNVTKLDYNTIFIVNLAVSITLYVILFFAAPFIADFFSQPRLTKISRILFTSVIFYALYFVQIIMIMKKLDYKTLAFINIFSIFISGSIAAILAYYNFGVWALVGQQISFQVIRFILFTSIQHWKPSGLYSFSTIKEFWTFSIHLLGTITLNVIFNQIYTILVGRFYPLQQVGYFSQANKLNENVNGATQQILNNSTYPLFVQIQDDRERLVRLYRKISNYVALLVFPMVAVLIAVAEPFLVTLISDKWLSSIVFFQLLLLSGFFTPLYTLNISILNAKGESQKTLKLEMIKKSIILLSILLCFKYGINSMLIGLVIANFSSYLISMFFIKNSLNHFIGHQLFDIIPAFILGSLIGGIVSLFNWTDMNLTLKLIIQLACAAILYMIVIRVFCAELFFKALQFIREKTPMKKF